MMWKMTVPKAVMIWLQNIKYTTVILIQPWFIVIFSIIVVIINNHLLRA